VHKQTLFFNSRKQTHLIICDDLDKITLSQNCKCHFRNNGHCFTNLVVTTYEQEYEIQNKIKVSRRSGTLFVAIASSNFMFLIHLKMFDQNLETLDKHISKLFFFSKIYLNAKFQIENRNKWNDRLHKPKATWRMQKPIFFVVLIHILTGTLSSTKVRLKDISGKTNCFPLLMRWRLIPN